MAPRQRKPRPPAESPADRVRREVEEVARLVAAPVRHPHVAGINVGDATHWVCVGETPDGSDPVREFPAHTPGLRDLVAWLRRCGVPPPGEGTGLRGEEGRPAAG